MGTRVTIDVGDAVATSAEFFDTRTVAVVVAVLGSQAACGAMTGTANVPVSGRLLSETPRGGQAGSHDTAISATRTARGQRPDAELPAMDLS